MANSDENGLELYDEDAHFTPLERRADGVLAGLMLGAFASVVFVALFANSDIRWVSVTGILAGTLVGYRLSERLARREHTWARFHPPERKVLLAGAWVLLALLVVLLLKKPFGISALWFGAAALLATGALSMLAYVKSDSTKLWVNREPRSPSPARLLSADYFMTGPEMVDKVVRAIELNQSVVLSGPRGCGKSFCVQKAIDVAAERGVIQRGAYRFLQGNKEIPRDYLVEDEIAFKTVQGTKGEDTVVPYRRSSPLFAFAKRSPVDGSPGRKKDSNNVICEITTSSGKIETVDKFVLFLDEINRFSDGVLDSLLSILEERKAVLAGEEYRLPVVVCMTMNPPGYDATARKLSPPLAARIGRSYRLFTPDLDTLSDVIIRSRLKALATDYGSKAGEPRFPEVPDHLIRKAALATLCLWGDILPVPGQLPKPGNDYLNRATRTLLESVLNRDSEIRDAMRVVSSLCLFGPDGRAAADWLTTAIGQALDEARVAGLKDQPAPLRKEHLTRTVVQCVAHKIYDNFSEGSRPDLTARKEQAVRRVCEWVFRLDATDSLIARIIDNSNDVSDSLLGPLGTDYQKIRACFLDAQVTPNELAKPWLDVGKTFKKNGTGTVEGLLLLLTEHNLVVPQDKDQGLKAGFNDRRHDELARRLARLGGPGMMPKLLSELFDERNPRIGAVRLSVWDEVASDPAVLLVGVERLREVLERTKSPSRRDVEMTVASLRAIRDYEPAPGEDIDPGEARLMESLKEIWGSQERPDATIANAIVALASTVRERAAAGKGERAYHYREVIKRIEQRLEMPLSPQKPLFVKVAGISK
jgi:MoxR-like ATPase